MDIILKYIGSLAIAMLSMLEPTIPFAVVLFFAVILDCASAFDLNRRLRRQGLPADGKFKSGYALRMLGTFIKAYSVVVLLHLVDVAILTNVGYLNLSNIAAAVFCFIELWSILENASSANGARWAKILQRIMVSKVSRHLDIDEKVFDTDSTEKTTTDNE